MSNERRRLQALLRNDFSTFIEKTFQHLQPGAEYHSNWHLRAIAHQLERCRNGEIDRLIITLPPRHLKSICASVAFPAWLLGQDPSCNVVCVSYSNELSAKIARDCRNVVESSWYKKLFKGTHISRRKNTEMEFETTKHGGRLATSVDGTLTGRGGRFLIIDDPIKPDGAMSETERQGVNDWFRRTAYTRLDDRKAGAIIIVMQRVHEDDLVGHVLDLDDWTVLNIPATAEERTEYRIGHDPADVYVREVGEVIDGHRQNAEELARLKRMLGTFNFSAQYQQNPIPVDGNLVKRDWFQTYAELPPRDVMDAVVLSWDTASAAGEMNDYSVCTVWAVVGPHYYLIDVVRRKLDYPDLRTLAFQMVRRYDADLVLVERAGTGTALAQELRRAFDIRVRSLAPKGDKEIRFATQSHIIEQGRVFLPEDAPWLNTFIKELLGFPGTRHDDQVDSVELFLRIVNGRRGVPGTRARDRDEQGSTTVRPRSGRRTSFNARRYVYEKARESSNPVALF